MANFVTFDKGKTYYNTDHILRLKDFGDGNTQLLFHHGEVKSATISLSPDEAVKIIRETSREDRR